MFSRRALAMSLLAMTIGSATGQDPWIVYDGSDGRKDAKHIVLLAGDEGVEVVE